MAGEHLPVACGEVARRCGCPLQSAQGTLQANRSCSLIVDASVGRYMCGLPTRGKPKCRLALSTIRAGLRRYPMAETVRPCRPRVRCRMTSSSSQPERFGTAPPIRSITSQRPADRQLNFLDHVSHISWRTCAAHQLSDHRMGAPYGHRLGHWSGQVGPGRVLSCPT